MFNRFYPQQTRRLGIYEEHVDSLLDPWAREFEGDPEGELAICTFQNFA
jgi:hypothetical protein